jgi:hypothetical protein
MTAEKVTPEFRAKMRRAAKKVWRERKAKAKAKLQQTKESTKHANKQGPPREAKDDFRIAYAFGYCQAWLQIYADSTGISRATLAHRVGALLQVPPGR